MAQIIVKRSSVPGKVPLVGDLALGEIAINTNDGIAYIKKDVGGTQTVVPLSGGTGSVTSVGGTGTVSGLTLSGTVTTSGSLTLGGTLTLTSDNVTTALGFTPYNATNPASYITESALTPYLTAATAESTYAPIITTATLASAQTLTNKTIDIASNTLTGVQPTLISGTNIKTVNGESILGSGNIVINTALQNRYVYTATSDQTTFAAVYSAPYVDVYYNGVKLVNSVDFTATDNANIVLTLGAVAGDTVDIIAQKVFEVATISTTNLLDWPAALTVGELAYVDGVTSPIQTQINTKASTGKAIAMAMIFG